jgi:hypothetical protein
VLEEATGSMAGEAFAELEAYPGRQALAYWLLTLPAFRRRSEYED